MQEQLTVWNDEADLLRRAVAPQAEWFPVPQRAAAMQPLVWLLALVPILLAGVRAPWTEDAARWGLRSLKLLSADEWAEFLDPGDIVFQGALAYEPPLMTWLTAASIWCAGPSQPSAVIFPAALCVFLIVVVSFELARTLGEEWLGLLTAVLVATHPMTQQLVQQPTAATMGLTMSLLTLWSLLCHAENGGATWSRWLLLGSLCWGLCLMSSGPMSVVTLIIVTLYLATAPKGSVGGRRIVPLNRKAGCTDWRQWKSLFIWMSLGILFGGWWPLMMASLHGNEFWPIWLGLFNRSGPAAPLTPEVHHGLESSTAAILPLLSGFVLLGMYRMQRIVFRNAEPLRRRSQHFLLIWTAVAVSLWLLSIISSEVALFQRTLWTAFLLIPLSILAAGGLLEIGERRAGFGATLAAYALGVIVAVWRYRGAWLDVSKLSHQFALVGALMIVFGSSLWLTMRFIHGHESRQRWLVQGGIWSLLIAHCVWGTTCLAVGPLAAKNSRELPLLQFWTDLRTWRVDQPQQAPGGELILMTPQIPSSRLHYLVQSVWPRRMLKLATGWETVSPRHPGSPSRIIVTYGKREMIRPSKPGDSTALVPIVPPRLYQQADHQQGELSAYDLRD